MAPGEYKDLLLDIGTEEICHVEMICTMIVRLVEDDLLSLPEAAADDNPRLAAIHSGSNPADFIHSRERPVLPV